LRFDPTAKLSALHLHPVPFPVCNFKAHAFGGFPNNTCVC
jgi:hypothetical protein